MLKTINYSDKHDIDNVIREINELQHKDICRCGSPIWYRPQFSTAKMYMQDELLQVVGHTPVNEIYKKNNVISCDVFSTFTSGKPIGTQEFLVLDTLTWQYTGIANNNATI